LGLPGSFAAATHKRVGLWCVDEKYQHVTEGLLSEGEQLTQDGFRSLLMRRLRMFIQRKAADAIKYHLEDEVSLEFRA
jgi:hypothetical protein